VSSSTREVIADGWKETRQKKQLFQMKKKKENERDKIRTRKTENLSLKSIVW
jgi:hypothetical protein